MRRTGARLSPWLGGALVLCGSIAAAAPRLGALAAPPAVPSPGPGTAPTSTAPTSTAATTSPAPTSTAATSSTAAISTATAEPRRRLTLTPELQRAGEHLLNRARPVAGALTLVDVATGRVLAAVELGDTSHGSLLVDARSPAASVFKLVTTIALYERTSVTPATRVCTKGGLRSIAAEHLLPGTGDGVVCSSFHQALGTSRNAAYAQLASRYLTPRDLLDTAERLGFNHPLSGQLPGTVGSLSVPEPSLDFARTAAGFENSKLSVFGAAELALAIARGGEHVPLRLYEERADALPLVEPAPRRLFSDRTAQRLRHSMEFTIHSGTAHDSFIDATGQRALGAIQAAGKTGTLRPRGSELTSSWFVGFAPSDKPRVVVSVVLLNSDLWFQKGQQLARDLLRVYFAKAGVPGVTAPWTPGEGSVAQPLATRSREAEGQEQPD